MKRLLIIAMLMLGAGSLLRAQTMVGLSKEEVIAVMKSDHRGFHKDQSVIKQRFNYLKYVNGPRTQTWIIYFDEQDVCKTSKVAIDYGDYDEVLADIEGRCRKTGELSWEFMSGKDTILVEIIKRDWYFSVRETKKK